VTPEAGGTRAAAARRVETLFEATAALHARLASTLAGPVADAAAAIAAAIGGGRRVLVFGNGGSAAEAQHFAAELCGRFERERAAWPALALTTDSSVITAVANDLGFDQVFARQVEAFGHPGDVAVALSTSGASPNIVEGARTARARGLTVVALTGRDGGALGAVADVHLHVPEASTARAQEVHLTMIHALCDLVEQALVQ
jgi:D-sedoheptulose 7-phosphate isomerase